MWCYVSIYNIGDEEEEEQAEGRHSLLFLYNIEYNNEYKNLFCFFAALGGDGETFFSGNFSVVFLELEPHTATPQSSQSFAEPHIY